MWHDCAKSAYSKLEFAKYVYRKSYIKRKSYCYHLKLHSKCRVSLRQRNGQKCTTVLGSQPIAGFHKRFNPLIILNNQLDVSDPWNVSTYVRILKWKCPLQKYHIKIAATQFPLIKDFFDPLGEIPLTLGFANDCCTNWPTAAHSRIFNHTRRFPYKIVG